MFKPKTLKTFIWGHSILLLSALCLMQILIPSHWVNSNRHSWVVLVQMSSGSTPYLISIVEPNHHKEENHFGGVYL